MATTTNYGWTTPDDTALVKDGAAAIRTLGSSVDTTTKALNPSTTLGDIEYRSSTANTNTRLGIGSTGQVLSVAGGVPSWTTPAGGGKVLQVVQGSSTTATTITSTTMTDTTLSLSITPTSATSKILVLVSQQFELYRGTGNETGYTMRILRGATEVYATGSTNTAGYIFANGASQVGIDAYVSLTYLDSPATTSATTYKTQGRLQTAVGSLVYQNNSANSTITLMEIGA
jgi:hypothetical protein